MSANQQKHNEYAKSNGVKYFDSFGPERFRRNQEIYCKQ